MSFDPCPADVRPGDIVRCRSLVGLPPATPLALNHIYTIRANESLGDAEPMQGDCAPVLHLHGIPGTFAPHRFELVARHATATAPVNVAALAMAQVMRERVQLTGTCTERDLACAGFTDAQIRDHADAARGVAGFVTESMVA